MMCGLDDGRKSRDDDNHGAWGLSENRRSMEAEVGGGGGGNWEPVEEKTRGRMRERKLKKVKRMDARGKMLWCVEDGGKRGVKENKALGDALNGENGEGTGLGDKEFLNVISRCESTEYSSLLLCYDECTPYMYR
jgi:hypothetical protein